MEKEGLVNNEFYHSLGESWYTADDHAIALLRAEHVTRFPWMLHVIGQNRDYKNVLDIGCGGGFLSNRFAQEGFSVTGVDFASDALEIAQKHDATKSVHYLKSDAAALPFKDETFDVACALDLLEHVPSPQKVIEEAGRILRPGGLFFFHTFNRTLMSYLVAVKGIEWFVAKAPKNIHIYSLFIKPSEIESYCTQACLSIAEMRGFSPKIGQKAFWKMLLTGRVSPDFTFIFTKSLATGYTGYAVKNR